jgi:hypothetical protein
LSSVKVLFILQINNTRKAKTLGSILGKALPLKVFFRKRRKYFFSDDISEYKTDLEVLILPLDLIPFRINSKKSVENRFLAMFDDNSFLRIAAICSSLNISLREALEALVA